MVLYSTI